MKRTDGWSHGILLVMFGIVVAMLGVMQALMLPMPGITNWAFTIVGAAAIVAGVIVASRAKVDRSVPANEKRLPKARLHRSPRR